MASCKIFAYMLLYNDMKPYLILPPLTCEQIEIINGSLLGDASIGHSGKPNHNGSLIKSQSKFDILGIDKIDYMQWHINKLTPYSNMTIYCKSSKYKIINNKLRQPCNVRTAFVQYVGYVFTTHRNPILTDMSYKWYATDCNGHYTYRNKRRVKIIPHDIKLTPLTLCVWHMDDGYANSIDGNITLNTQGFTWDECEFLSERLRLDLNITSKVRAKDGHQIIYVPLKSYFDFINIIKPYVEWNCFKHKIDMETYNKKPQIGETHSQATFTNSKIKQLVQLHKQGWSHEKLSKKFRTAKANISLILSGSHWSHITGIQYKPTKPRMGEEVKRHIVELSQVGLTQKEIAKTLKINQSTVSRTIKGAICQTSVT